ncbi:hypothetical protein POF51_25975 [Brevibacillus sp. AG]|uniref:hypothetical protein n=1 Tax=Brevibacillus sp. AG TaxID=3020891 RepID=UPI00232E60A9|nr:hypothetical protein [Brevibacillus sp. AG]MDC0764172.1 hypothetical protein [Brevibacillus sp. AG]
MIRGIFVLVTMMVLVMSFAGATFAASGNAGNSNSIGEILGNELIKSEDANFNDQKLQSSLAKIVGVVRLVGAGICFIMLVITGILFSTSGKNEQRRSGAFLSLIGVAAGVFIIMQASMIASWFASIGT